MSSVNENEHLGHLFLNCMKAKDPNDIYQIDAATDQTETYGSGLDRSVRLARCLRKIGLKPGDVLALGGPNHIDLRIPYNAGLLNGLPIAGVDPYFKYSEIKYMFKILEPKVAFCQYETYDVYQQVAKELGLDMKIITFDEGACTLANFVEKYDDKTSIDDFEPATFDLDKVYAWLVSTSGSTGMPKLAAFKHRDLLGLIQKYAELQTIFNPPTDNKRKSALCPSAVQWISAYFNALGLPVTNVIILQTSRADDSQHLIDVINKYKPASALCSPTLLAHILKSDQEDKRCDFSCFDTIIVGGAKVYREMMEELRTRVGDNAMVLESYGQTETVGPVMLATQEDPIGSCGKPLPTFEVKIVDPETGKEITEPDVVGELWTKGPTFSGYYKNPEETANALANGGWYKTGDLFKKDSSNKFYFVDRLKMLIKYKNIQVYPPEIEEVIHVHEGVQDVGVTSVPHPQDGQWPVACVVRQPGSDVTAQEIKDLVASKLSSFKQLRGGVIFLDSLPMTSSGKIARGKLQEIALNSPRQ